jgi:hypothetical protein
MKRAMLVYQAGIANVFQVRSANLSDYGRSAKRLIQSDFSHCAHFAQGLKAAGVIVHTAGCNQAGDIANAHWTQNLQDLPFSDKFIIVES